jgi:hypothetical protein
VKNDVAAALRRHPTLKSLTILRGPDLIGINSSAASSPFGDLFSLAGSHGVAAATLPDREFFFAKKVNFRQGSALRIGNARVRNVHSQKVAGYGYQLYRRSIRPW